MLATPSASTERIPAALESFVIEFSNQLDRLAKHNSRLKSMNDRIVYEGSVPCGEGKKDELQEGIIPKLSKYSSMLSNMLSEQESQIEKIERFV